ncbi:single-stranded DNA-binding protein [Limnoglobus roseus]|uniref:Single-stranded DNA-binding protein n=1 Tax=Limnoglobus roseus TaxID=2598579 RepID=A0A5C1A7U9_9BACT|nr:single-stranded DNA-binding protein [Limnoglobus roseus]QEL15271.1 single-stranded DNA-binding protein [Limnoglobus roseus]
MANFNKVMLIGRLTRDPETRAFQNGGMVAKFGFAVTNRKKNAQTGQWEDEPMFIDCEAFNRGEFGKLADLVRDRCHKGTQIMVEGRLHLDTWQDKTTNQNRTKHKIVVESIQLLDPRQAGGPGGGGMGGDEGGMDDMPSAPPARSTGGGRPPARGFTPPPQQRHDDGPGDDGGGDIPF